jgi:hypothetical protein
MFLFVERDLRLRGGVQAAPRSSTHTLCRIEAVTLRYASTTSPPQSREVQYRLKQTDFRPCRAIRKIDGINTGVLVVIPRLLGVPISIGTVVSATDNTLPYHPYYLEQMLVRSTSITEIRGNDGTCVLQRAAVPRRSRGA